MLTLDQPHPGWPPLPLSQPSAPFHALCCAALSPLARPASLQAALTCSVLCPGGCTRGKAQGQESQAFAQGVSHGPASAGVKAAHLYGLFCMFQISLPLSLS